MSTAVEATGLIKVTLDTAYIGHPKDRKKIDQAMTVMHEANLLGPKSLQEAPEILAQGLRLYAHLFPNPNERESDRLIGARLENDGIADGKASCFDIIIGRDSSGAVISWHQFSTIPLDGESAAVAYMQYTGSAGEDFMRREYGRKESHHGHGIYTYNIALMQQIADARARKALRRSQGLKGYILETEISGQGNAAEEIRYTAERLRIHERTGAKALMIRMKDGSLLSPHYQPSLGEGREATKLLLLFRPMKYDAMKIHESESFPKDEAERIVMAFIGNFETEGFDPRLVEEGRALIRRWFSSAESCMLVAPSQVPNVIEMSRTDDLLRKMTERDFGDLELHAAQIQGALKPFFPLV